MKKILSISFLILFVLTCIGVTGFLYLKGKKNKEVFLTDTVRVSDIYKKTIATGIIEPRREVIIKPQASGIIEKIFCKPGQKVKKGDIIASIKIIPNMININNAQTNLKTAQINYELAEVELKRRKRLFEDKVIPQVEYLEVEKDFRLKREQMEAAESYLELLKKGKSKRIQQNTSTTLIRATIDGRIFDIPVKEGTSVIESNNFNEGTTIATMANMKDMIFKGKVVESEVGKLEEGMELQLQIGAIPKQTFKANLEFIALKGIDDKGTIQFEIKAGLDASQTKSPIRAGYSASADVILEKKENALVIHEKNVEFKNDSAFIYLETKPQVFEKKFIQTGISDELNIEVLKGLKKSQRIKVLINQ